MQQIEHISHLNPVPGCCLETPELLFQSKQGGKRSRAQQLGERLGNHNTRSKNKLDIEKKSRVTEGENKTKHSMGPHASQNKPDIPMPQGKDARHRQGSIASPLGLWCYAANMQCLKSPPNLNLPDPRATHPLASSAERKRQLPLRVPAN